MNRWAALFDEMSNGMTDRDTARHIAGLIEDFTMCHAVSRIGNGFDTENAHGSPWSRRFDALLAEALTDRDTARHIDVSCCVSICHRVVHLDFETRNLGRCKLKSAGAWRYLADPATEVVTLTYRNGGFRSWTPADGHCERLAALAADPAVRFVSFSDFESIAWRTIMVGRYGFPPIPIERWDDARAVCSLLALPGSLGGVLPVIGAPTSKDTEGRRLVLSLSRPNLKTGAYPDLAPDVIDRVRAYNVLDVEGLAAVHAAVGNLPEHEQVVWELDQAINERGVGVDLGFVRAAKGLAETVKRGLFAE
jgi:DNA polymerase